MSDVFIIIVSLDTGYMDICFGNLAANSTYWLLEKSFSLLGRWSLGGEAIVLISHIMTSSWWDESIHLCEVNRSQLGSMHSGWKREVPSPASPK